MKILTVVGARPQFVKAAAVSRVLRRYHTELLVHTGQHYDPNMSDIFFEELHIPKPDYHLGIGSGSHGQQTGEMLMAVEQVILKEKPDALLVYGDTNSTLAGALAAVKLHVPVAHVEAGLRSFNRLMPEEINRVMTDHISEFLFCPTDTAVSNLRREGITDNVYQVGDVMCDAVRYYGKLSEKFQDGWYEQLHYLYGKKEKPDGFYMATIHRAENTDGTGNLKEILSAFESLDYPVLFPVHPRTRKLIDELSRSNRYANIHFVEPVGYLLMLYLVSHSIKTVTDSGGLQKEAYLLKTPCVTIRPQTEWVETLNGGYNVLSGANKLEILGKIMNTAPDSSQYKEYYGDGHAAQRIVDILNNR